MRVVDYQQILQKNQVIDWKKTPDQCKNVYIFNFLPINTQTLNVLVDNEHHLISMNYYKFL